MYITVRACHCVSSTRVPRYTCMKCVHGFIPLSKIKLNVINTDFGGLYCPGIVHLLIFSYVHCTLTMRSLSLSAPFAFTVLKALTVHSQSVYFSLTVRLAFIYRSVPFHPFGTPKWKDRSWSVKNKMRKKRVRKGTMYKETYIPHQRHYFDQNVVRRI